MYFEAGHYFGNVKIRKTDHTKEGPKEYRPTKSNKSRVLLSNGEENPERIGRVDVIDVNGRIWISDSIVINKRNLTNNDGLYKNKRVNNKERRIIFHWRDLRKTEILRIKSVPFQIHGYSLFVHHYSSSVNLYKFNFYESDHRLCVSCMGYWTIDSSSRSSSTFNN